MFDCNTCDNKTYSSQKALSKHYRQFHNIIFKEVLYECHQCNKTFPSKRKLQEHHSKNHKTFRIPGTTFQCDRCDKLYASKKYLKIHEKKHQSPSSLDKYECHTCGSIFDTKNEICDHIKLHNRCKNLLCPFNECQESYNRYKHLRSHISDYHNLHLITETYTFSTNEEFNKWRSAKEQELKANYILSTSEKKLKEGVRTYYICHRSQAPRITETPKRNAKSMGTNKIGRTCPSTMIVTSNQECISVVFFPVHVGHCNELGRLRIDETDRIKIAGKLSQGVPIGRVLSDIRESAPSGEMERVHLIEKKDLNNIVRDFSIGYTTKRHKNDAVSVQLWVKAMQLLENNPVLFYKNSEEDYEGVFDKNDFVLIIMTEFQKKSLISFGQDKICIDGTHGLNQYGFQLYTVVIVDEYGSGVPAAFCFSNRSDETLFQHFFQCIKDSVGLLSANVFMSDDYPAFYNAWKSVMSEVPNRLLCTWHINKNWVQNSGKILDKNKRSLVLKTLKVLQKEIDGEAFQNELKTFVHQLQNDSDTLQFYQYFSRTYLNRLEMWAYCHRKYLGINTNMYLESLHKVIKHFYLEGRKCKRLDKTINALMNLVRDKMFERVIKLEKHKVSGKIQKIRNSHRLGGNISRDCVQQKNEKQWCVISSNDNDHTYLVEKIGKGCIDLCELKCKSCQICIHCFKCSCLDNVINYNICKHIHACCLYFFNNVLGHAPSVFKSESNNVTNNFISAVPSSSNSNRDLLNSKLEVLIGLNNRFNLGEADENIISKYLDKAIDIYNTNGQVNFEVKESVTTTQKLEPQVRMFSAKRKRRSQKDIQQPLAHETKSIKLALADSEAKVPNISTDFNFEHSYSKL
ncbi:uncharacterized protein LOC126892122 [Diabrotica virgifera virgifera]|uniref:C2H2-type domain-containing protein n=1 Tax=Diabrotica virgifera virgifera TaxID=50390 RepID=A0ABM5L537_DIAVI|nr:uncharacterized protein LOC126892122 [Diabrotica virgifera virgifera]